MPQTIEVQVPNIGDFRDVPIVDILVKPGDNVGVEEPLVTLESEKATMEIPSPHAGVVQSVAVAVGDKVSEGSALVTLSAESDTPPPAEPVKAAPPAAEPAGGAPAARAAQTTLVELRVPDIGDFTDVPVIEVLVAPGDRVEREASLVTLESEKASLDIPAVAAGTIQSIAVKVGDKVSQGTLLGTLESSETLPAVARSETATGTAGIAAPSNGVPAPQPKAAQPKAAPPPAPAPEAEGVIHASPAIRRFARELGVELRGVRGSGPHERVMREDVQQYVKRALAAPPPAARTASGEGLDLLPWPKVDFEKFGPIERVPLSRIRKLSGPNLHRNWVLIPHVTNNDEADVTELESLRKALNAENPGAKVTMLAFVIKAAVAALKAFPDLNSSLDGDSLVLKKYYNIGFAADTPSGLIVPVLKAADQKGVLAIASETSALAAKAREGKLALGDMQGATFTISSLGGIGGTSFSPIINAPEVAILGISRSAMRPVWDGQAFVPRVMLPLSLSYDHRVIDGALAARFNAHLGVVLGDLRRALL